MQKNVNFRPHVFILDVDGVMTDGSFFYSSEGKFAKRFGADDHDALTLLKKHLEILFVTGDHRGFDISHKRIAEDMKTPLELVSTVDRLSWIKDRFDPATVIYMGDGIFDARVFQGVGYAISVADSLDVTKRHADFVTSRVGGNRAVAEAALHILATFFEPFEPAAALPKGTILSGRWESTESCALPEANLREVAIRFFADYAAKRLDNIKTLLADDVHLYDADIKATGKDLVLASFQTFFSTVSRINIQIKELHEKAGGLLAEVVIGTDCRGSLSAIYSIAFSTEGKILQIEVFHGGTA